MQYSSSDEVKAVVMMMKCSEKFENGEAEKIVEENLQSPSIELELPLPGALLLLTW
jgi:hypothetical protein